MDLNKVNTPHYNDYGTWIRRQFPYRVQKISIDAGFTCPNRDGRISTGGCIYCDNRTFNPSYCQRRHSVTQQLEEGKRFFAHKYPDMKYLAYFQAFTNTYAPLSQLKALYEEALQVDDIVGIVIGTRPDCVSDELLDYLAELNQRTFVLVEYGIESANNDTLLRINRGHSFEQSQEAIQRTHQRGLLTGAHIILGLPGEDAAESLRQASIISSLPSDADYPRNATGRRVCRQPVPHLYCRRIYPTDCRVHPAPTPRPYSRALCFPIAQGAAHRTTLGTKKLRVYQSLGKLSQAE